MYEGSRDDGILNAAGFYEIRIKGCIDPASGWFDGMTVTPLDGNETLIAGPVADQAALHGLLMRIRDLNLPLLSVRQVVPDALGELDEKTGDADEHGYSDEEKIECKKS